MRTVFFRMKGIIVKSLFIAAVIALGVLTGGYLALTIGVPNIDQIRGHAPFGGTTVYADDDTVAGEFKIEKGEYVKISDIPEDLIKAIVAVEDSRFWLHQGVDYIAIVRALLQDIYAGRIKQGASTITQQLAKVVFLSPERTIIRKLKEATLAFRLERNLTKKEILEIYLNKIYFGQGAYGVEMAAKAYFGKPVSDVSLAEAALLCGLVKAPNRYSPYTDLDKAKQRQHIVLKRMEAEGYITREQAEEAYEKPLHLSSSKNINYTQNYFLEYVRKYLEDEYGLEATYKGGMKVYTTLNRNMQAAAVNSLRDGLMELDKRQGFRGPMGHKEVSLEDELKKKGKFDKVVMGEGDLMTAVVLSVSGTEALVKTRGITGKLFLKDSEWAGKVIDSKGNLIKMYKNLRLRDILKQGDIINVMVKSPSADGPVFKLEQEPLVQGAVVAIESSTGYIRAIVGGYDFGKSEYNRAVYARRQAGSAFKPVIFAAALDKGLTPASIIVDEPLKYGNEEFGVWEPENYNEKYNGATRLRTALAHSMNIITVKLLEEVGVDNVIKFARRLGIKGPFPNDLTLALGSLSVSPLEITSAYSVLAQNGVRREPVAIKYIIDREGNVVENNEPKGAVAIDPLTAFLSTSMLEDVVKTGTGWRAKDLQRPAAGKTGTTNDYKDAWFIGYTTELVAGVWVGFDNMRPLGKDETGSKAAAPIWVSFMKEAVSGEIRPFQVPDGIVTAVIDPVTGLLATNETEKMVEFFKEGTVPAERSTEGRRKLIEKRKKELKIIDEERRKEREDNKQLLNN